MCVRAKSSPTVLRAEFAAGRICVPNLRPRYFPVAKAADGRCIM